MLTADVVVLGAGMVGVSAALHLQARGRDVAIIDRHGAAGLETSFGNAGLIERSSLFPYLFPRDPRRLALYALNLLPEAHYHVSAIPEFGPWLLRYWRESAPERVAKNAAAVRPLIENCVSEHQALVEMARSGDLLRKSGWLKAFRSEAAFAIGAREAEKLRGYGLRVDILDAAAVHAREPALAPLAGAAHFLDTMSIDDPSRLAQSYADLFVARGGRFLSGDARSFGESGDGRWSVETHDGMLAAKDMVVALGPWSGEIFRPLGYAIPLGFKRGYHMHYAQSGAPLRHPVLDAENGYVLAPMTRGVRLTTGAEFARRDAPPTPVQVDVCEKIARSFAPLGERLDAKPWMGARPCLPDMLPVIGPAPRHPGLWFDFGHAHHGVTLGPVSGRLLAEMMTGETPFTDPAPYSVLRF